MTPIISAKDIFKQYSPLPQDEVLRELGLDIHEGEILAIVGPSGVGKSTLLNILGLLDPPTSGTILYYGSQKDLRGKDLTKISRKKQAQIRNCRFGFIFQLYHLLPDLTVTENVMLPLLISAGYSGWLSLKKKGRKEAGKLLEKVGISHRAGAYPNELSGGEKQRAAIARALIAGPELVLCDEPTGNLDSNTSERIHSLLFQLNREEGVTLVIVTHDRNLSGYARRTLCIKNGRLTVAQ